MSSFFLKEICVAVLVIDPYWKDTKHLPRSVVNLKFMYIHESLTIVVDF